MHYLGLVFYVGGKSRAKLNKKKSSKLFTKSFFFQVVYHSNSIFPDNFKFYHIFPLFPLLLSMSFKHDKIMLLVRYMDLDELTLLGLLLLYLYWLWFTTTDHLYV